MTNLEVGSHYKGERGAIYLRERLSAGDEFYRLELEFFRPYLSPSTSVLEFGCGAGQLLALIKPLVARAEAVEVNDAARAAAIARDLVVYPHLEAVPFGPDSKPFDVIVSNHVLEHVPDVGAALRELRSRLRPGGLLVVKLPIDDFRGSHQKRWDRNDIDHHLHTWTPRLFANQLFDAGFDVESIRVLTSALHDRIVAMKPAVLRNLAARAFAYVMRRRQLLAVARNPA